MSDGAANGPELLAVFPLAASTGFPDATMPVKRINPPEAPFEFGLMSEPLQLVVLKTQVWEVGPAALSARNQKVSCKILSSRLFLRIVVHPAGGQIKTFAIASVMTTCATRTSPAETAGAVIVSSRLAAPGESLLFVLDPSATTASCGDRSALPDASGVGAPKGPSVHVRTVVNRKNSSKCSGRRRVIIVPHQSWFVLASFSCRPRPKRFRTVRAGGCETSSRVPRCVVVMVRAQFNGNHSR